ncbi:hypothetical protein ALC57_10832, partial [Trachymyrmex cornetzi]
ICARSFSPARRGRWRQALRLKTRRQLLRGIMRNPVNAPVSGHHSTASLTLGSIGMQ